jgi:DNA-binding NarL/FixJ family response regulator
MFMFKVLLADDHVLLRDGLKRIIEEHGRYKVVGEVGDGLEVVSQVRKVRPQLLILDISMPSLRGIEAIGKIRKFDRALKILVLTMHKNEDYVYECLVNGAQGYILKEDAANELLSAIDSIRKGRVYVSSSFSSEVIKNLVFRRSAGDGQYARSVFNILTLREREVLKLLAEGNSNKKVAHKLGISVRTVEHHRTRLMKKLGLSNIAKLVKYALKQNIIE